MPPLPLPFPGSYSTDAEVAAEQIRVQLATCVCALYPGTDVVSLVPDFFSALTFAGLCLLLVEPAKMMASVLPGQRIARHLSFVVYQAMLVVDILRRYAWDWYGYLLYFLRLVNLDYNQPRPEILPLPPPWLSFMALLLCLGLCVYARDQPDSRARRDESATA